jgi:hypothetical protein
MAGNLCEIRVFYKFGTLSLVDSENEIICMRFSAVIGLSFTFVYSELGVEF